jgi:hypothetical protein
MSVVANEEAGNLVHLELQGRLSPADQATIVYFLTKAAQRHGRIRLLVTLAGFAGWTEDDDWGDEGLRVPDDAAILKAAFTGEPRWKDEIFAFVAKPFREIPIEYFTSAGEARAWLDA